MITEQTDTQSKVKAEKLKVKESIANINQELHSANPREAEFAQTIEQQRAQKKKDTFKNILRGLFIVAATAILIVVMFSKEGATRVREVFGNVKWEYMALSSVLYLSFVFFDALLIHYLKRCFGVKGSFAQQYSLSMFGVLINSLTPAMLELAMAAHIQHRNNECGDAAKASAIMFMKNVYFVVGQTISFFLFSCLSWPFLKTRLNFWIILFASLGLAINFVGQWLIFLFGPRCTKQVKAVAMPVIGFLGRIKVIKSPDRTQSKLDTFLSRLKANSERKLTWSQKIIATFLAFLYGLCWRVSLIPIPYALGIQKVINPFNLIGGYTLLDVVSFLAVPGGFGLSDYAFSQLMVSQVGSEFIVFFMMLWRIATYYIPIVYGAIGAIIILKRGRL